MIEETGTVIALDGCYALVHTERRSACGSCRARSACGTSLLDRVLGRRLSEVHALNAAGAEVGEQVILGISEQGFLGLAVATYLIPTLSLIAGALSGNALGADPGALLGMVLGLGAGLLWLRRDGAAHARDPARQPVVLRRVSAPSLTVSFITD